MLNAAIDWAFSEERESWKRTVKAIDKKKESYSLESLMDLKESLIPEVKANIDLWFSDIYNKRDEFSSCFQSEENPEYLWQCLISMNTGIFKRLPHQIRPLLPMVTFLSSQHPGEGPLILAPCPEGWGVKV